MRSMGQLAHAGRVSCEPSRCTTSGNAPQHACTRISRCSPLRHLPPTLCCLLAACLLAGPPAILPQLSAVTRKRIGHS